MKPIKPHQSFLKPQLERMRATRERAASGMELMPSLEDLRGPFCAACGRQLTHPNQYVLGGTKRRPRYYCRRKVCRPRRRPITAPKRGTGHQANAVQRYSPRKQEAARPARRRHLGNLFGLL